MYHNEGMFCTCCGMQLRLTLCSRACKETHGSREVIGLNGYTVSSMLGQPECLQKYVNSFILRYDRLEF
jgi:hypothetical protein